MTLSLIEAQINEFLKTDIPEILAIKGLWGVGKTFLWNKILYTAKERYGIALKQYAYVSLFGINSLEELKLTLFAQVGSVDHIGSEKDPVSVTNIDRIISSWSRKGFPLLKDLPVIKDFWHTTKSLAFLSVKKTLICIDDFERKGKDLCTRDVLGLVNLLKEEKKCKIALIFNEEALKNESGEFEKFREKVIDFELIFSPTPSECSTIALNDDPTSTILKGYVEHLGINNIRVIKKIERLATIIVSKLDGFRPEVIDKALHSLTLFAWSLFRSSDSVPDCEFIKKTDFLFGRLWRDDEQKNESKEEKKTQDWQSLLNRYGFHGCEQFDLCIADIVQCGYVDETSLLNEATKLNQRIIASGSQNSLYEALAVVDESFDDDEKEFVESLNNKCKDNIDYIRPIDLDRVVTTLRKFDRDDLSDALIQDFVNRRSGEPKVFELQKGALRGQFKDTKLIEIFADVHESKKEKRTLKEVLEKIAGKQGWDHEDEIVLSEATIEDYFQLFKSERGPHLSLYVSTCLEFGEYTTCSPEQKRIASNATEALKRIAGENRLNAMRVKRLGVKF